MKQTAIIKAIANLEEGARIIKNLNVSLTAKEVAESLDGFREYLQSLLPEEKEQMEEAWNAPSESELRLNALGDKVREKLYSDFETYFNNKYKPEVKDGK